MCFYAVGGVAKSGPKGYLWSMNADPRTTAAFTGHRTYDGAAAASLAAAVERAYARGYRTFLSGMAVGFDLAAAETVVSLRGTLPGLRLCCAVPCPGQADRFAAADRARYHTLLATADEVVLLAERYEPKCYLRRDEFMVDRSACLVAWYDGSKGGTRYTWEYACRRGVERVNLWRDPQGTLF